MAESPMFLQWKEGGIVANFISREEDLIKKIYAVELFWSESEERLFAKIYPWNVFLPVKEFEKKEGVNFPEQTFSPKEKEQIQFQLFQLKHVWGEHNNWVRLIDHGGQAIAQIVFRERSEEVRPRWGYLIPNATLECLVIPRQVFFENRIKDSSWLGSFLAT